MKDKEIWFKIIFSFTFVGIAIFMILSDWAKQNITNTSIALILIAFLPWILKYIKSMEFFGIKTELFSKQEIDKVNEVVKDIEKADDEENIEPVSTDKVKIEDEKIVVIESINSISEANDLITKLVLTRFELEKLMKKFCDKYNVSSIGTIQSIAQRLYKNNYIDRSEYEAINEILPILNKAIHSDIDNIDKEQLLWVVEKGSSLLVHLELNYNDLRGFATIKK